MRAPVMDIEQIKEHEVFMLEAYKQAKAAEEKDEVPVGAIVTFENKIIAKAHNHVEMLKDPSTHAEMIALTQAASFLSSKWLHNCNVYVTIEPCPMCAGALVLARVKRLFFSAYDPKSGACGSVMNIAEHKELNHRIEVVPGLLEEECSELISNFFRQKRRP